MSTSHSASGSQSFRVSVKIFSRSALVGGRGGRKNFYRGQYLHSSAQPWKHELWMSSPCILNVGVREMCGGQLFAWNFVSPLPAIYIHRHNSKTALNKIKNKYLPLLEISLFLDPEDGGSRLSLNVHNGLQIYTASLVSFPLQCACVCVCVHFKHWCTHCVTEVLSTSIYFNFLEE